MPLLNIKRNLLLFFVSAMVASCTLADHSNVKPAPSLTFDYLQPLSAKSGATKITQSFVPDAMTAKVTKEFGESPAHLIYRYAQSRFETNLALKPPRMIFDIKQASLKKKTYQNDPLLFMEGTTVDHYKMVVWLELFPMDNGTKASEPFTVYFEQELKLSENVSLADRENAQFEFYEHMINDIDKVVSDIVLNKL